MKPNSPDLSVIATAARVLALLAFVAALSLAKEVLIPLTLGLLLSFLLSPLVNRLQRMGIPNVPAVIMTAVLAFVLLACGFTLLGREITRIANELPNYRTELLTKARGLAGMTTGVGGKLDDLAEEVSEAIEDGGNPVPPPEQSRLQQWTDRFLPLPKESTDEPVNDGSSPESPLFVQAIQKEPPVVAWATTAGSIVGPLATAGLVSVFALFMLIHREDLRDRILAVISHGNYVTTTEALDEVAQRISRYLMAQTILNVSYGCVLSLGLAVIAAVMSESGQFPNVILWGVLAATLRYIPYAGPIAAAIFPLLVALSMFPGYGIALVVLAFIVTLELVSNNVLEPWLYGTSTGISAVAIIVAAVFWGWLWGPVGLLLSTPLTVCMVVLGRHVPRFRILATLMGDDVRIADSLRLYQRLLVGDQHRASELIKQSLSERDYLAVSDEIVIPMIKRIRRDHDAERLSDADVERLFALTDGLIDELSTIDAGLGVGVSEEEETSDELDNRPVVAACTAHHYSESLVLNLLRRGGNRTPFRLDAIDSETMPEVLVKRIAESNPAAVLIAVVPKGGFVQSRYLCRSIRKAGYRGPIVIACFGKFKNFDNLFVKFRKAGGTNMTTTLAQTQSKLAFLTRQNAGGPLAVTATG